MLTFSGEGYEREGLLMGKKQVAAYNCVSRFLVALNGMFYPSLAQPERC